MMRSRPGLIVLAVAAGLLVLVVIIGSVAGFYGQVSLASPALARLLLGVLTAIALCFLGLGIYYARLFLRPQRRPRPVVLADPTDKVAIANQTLQATEQQVQAIHDDIARQALLAQSQELTQQLAGRPLQIVVFGTGSAGKTALVNAILETVAGEVGATMGTTAEAIAHPLRLRDFQRDIWLVDTPGLLEASVQGPVREQQTRQLAAAADLLLFVIDDDLRQSEWEPLQALLVMGKRSLVVLNKQDLRLAEDTAAIQQRLAQRLHPWLPAADIVAIAARPAPVQLSAGDWVTPAPAIDALLERMALVLRREGEILVADNLLLQAKQLSDQAQTVLANQRRQQAEAIVERYQWIGAGVVAMTPLPVIDFLATAAVNAQMVLDLGRVYGVEMSIAEGRSLAKALAKTLVALGLVKGGMQLLNVAMQTNVATFVINRGIQGVTAAYLTRVAGKSFITYFEQAQTWGDGGITAVVTEQFQLNQREAAMQTFVAAAIARVITPLEAGLEPLTPGEDNRS